MCSSTVPVSTRTGQALESPMTERVLIIPTPVCPGSRKRRTVRRPLPGSSPGVARREKRMDDYDDGLEPDQEEVDAAEAVDDLMDEWLWEERRDLGEDW